ncbi:MAG: HAMP domain-containing histidine kinase, partial [Planctomycetia bacterium]|nr:HAMP domain-containing histidine kinase [Planctomycetia bacterium]
RLTRSNARLRLQVNELSAAHSSCERLLSAMAASDPTDPPEFWAERAGLAWCGEAGVSTARVDWGATPYSPQPPGRGNAGLPAVLAPEPASRPPSLDLPLVSRGRAFARVQLWSQAETMPRPSDFASILRGWEAWGGLVADRARLADRLDEVRRAYRHAIDSDEQRIRHAKLDALAEFAAGAGHELNNPLAVIVGRAQLLLVHEADPKAVRSLRAILVQAQRAHRILRDLMYVARPPEPRPRFCQPDEIVRASVRDARADAEDREVRLAADPLDHGARVWADPDALRHLADILIRNALESTPKGGLVRVSTAGDATSLRWSVLDSGRGITPAEGGHLFDPFFCGRQAGRGLGMGLP